MSICSAAKRPASPCFCPATTGTGTTPITRRAGGGSTTAKTSTGEPTRYSSPRRRRPRGRGLSSGEGKRVDAGKIFCESGQDVRREIVNLCSVSSRINVCLRCVLQAPASASASPSSPSRIECRRRGRTHAGSGKEDKGGAGTKEVKRNSKIVVGI